jgi:hypothetical protein
LVEDNKIINNQTEVSEILNNFFINVAKDIGSSNIKSDESHPSISKIIANTPDIENLVFHDIKEDLIVYCSFKKFRNYWQYTHRPVVTFI